jgi:hypothetical protein
MPWKSLVLYGDVPPFLGNRALTGRTGTEALAVHTICEDYCNVCLLLLLLYLLLYIIHITHTGK